MREIARNPRRKTPDSKSRPGRTLPLRILVPLIVACALFMENLDATVLSTALPAIAHDLHESPIQLKLALTSYLLTLAVFIPASGWVADRFGTRVVFRLAILIFALGSALCGFAGSIPALMGPVIGPPVGGFITTYFTWRWIFWINLPMAALGIALATLYIPNVRGETVSRFDYIGFILSGVGLAALV